MVKAGLSPPKKSCFISYNERHLKMIKNALYFMLKVLFISRYLIFSLNFLVIRNLRPVSKLMTSQPGLQTFTIHIFPNMS